MFDEQYYNDKKQKLEQKKIKKVFDYFNQSQQLLKITAEDLDIIIQDENEINKQIDDEKKKHFNEMTAQTEKNRKELEDRIANQVPSLLEKKPHTGALKEVKERLEKELKKENKK